MDEHSSPASASSTRSESDSIDKPMKDPPNSLHEALRNLSHEEWYVPHMLSLYIYTGRIIQYTMYQRYFFLV